MNNTIDRQNAILSSFLFLDDIGGDKTKAFKLDVNIFTTPFRKRIAEKINIETSNEQMYGYLNVTIGDSVGGTKYETDFIDIVAQTPMPILAVFRIYQDLIAEYKKRIVMETR